MSDTCKHASPAAGLSRRWTVGVLLSTDCSRLSAALVVASGQGLTMRPEVGDAITAQVPRETAALFAKLADPAASVSVAEAAEMLAALRVQLADHEAGLIDALLAQASVSPDRVLAIGVHDPGLWTMAKGRPG